MAEFSSHDAIIVEAALIDHIIDRDLGWKKIMNQRRRGVGKEMSLVPDGTPLCVVLCYNLKGMGSFTINNKRRFWDSDFSAPLAHLLQSPKDIVGGGLERLSIFELRRPLVYA